MPVTINNHGSRSLFAERAFKYVNGDDINNQHYYRVLVDIREDAASNGLQYTSVPREKVC
jgi:hypothetical protein